jgi:hypothetical protein
MSRRRQTARTSDQRHHLESLEQRLLLSAAPIRSFDGSGNNLANPEWGAADTPLLRNTTVEYGPGLAGDFPALAPRVDSAGNTINPRTVSNLVFDQDVSILNDRGLTSFLFQWGQFLDHDMDLTEDFDPVGVAALLGENISFTVPTDGTESELPAGTIIPQLRSRFEWDDQGVAQQINQITSFLDASNVYGSDEAKADGLRAHFGGFLLTSDGVNNVADGSGQFLPLNTLGLPNAAPPTTGTGSPLSPTELFVAGDVRANEQPGLATMHTLFVLEHNYQARQLADRLGLSQQALAHPQVDEFLFQAARAIVGAEVQSITYNEFLPALLGPDQLESYRGYQDQVNASIANIFSAALYRVGHTMLPNELLLLNPDGSPVPDDPDVRGSSVVNGEVGLGESFFNPDLIKQFGIEPYLKGLAEQQIQEIDRFIVDGVRNLLFDPPAAVDLGATNLQRGRDHGLPDYNQARLDFGLSPRSSLSEVSSDPSVVAALGAAHDAANDGVNGYSAINNIDVFTGAISEDQIPGGSVGELMQAVLVDQFTRLRDGDRFYYENIFRGPLLAKIQNTRLSDIIRRNTGLNDVQDEVFRTAEVFTYRAPEGRRGADITLRVRHGELQVTQGRRVLTSQPLVDTQIVALFGTSRSDRIVIDKSVAELFDGSVEVHGNGRFDHLRVERPHGAGPVSRGPHEIHIGDLSVFHGNVEWVSIRGGHGFGHHFAAADGISLADVAAVTPASGTVVAARQQSSGATSLVGAITAAPPVSPVSGPAAGGASHASNATATSGGESWTGSRWSVT